MDLCHAIQLSLPQMNVLVDETRCVRLTDFGLANFADAGASAGTIMAGAARYMAPEILGPDLVQPAENQDNLPAGGIRHTSASDMFSFGQVAWHVRLLIPKDVLGQ